MGIYSRITQEEREVSKMKQAQNNNPLNVWPPPGDTWLGQTGVDDRGHAVFGWPGSSQKLFNRFGRVLNGPDSIPGDNHTNCHHPIIWGYRAAIRNLSSYMLAGKLTAREIVESWTATEADWDSYEKIILAGVYGCDCNDDYEHVNKFVLLGCVFESDRTIASSTLLLSLLIAMAKTEQGADFEPVNADIYEAMALHERTL